ncbi:MAG: OmpH family outer membrane protein [Bacteroidales bacterium]
MKRFFGIAALAVIMIFLGHSVEAQNMKFGHINSDELIRSMPEYDSAMAKLERARKEIVSTLEIMQVEFNNKYEAYNKDVKNFTDLVRQTKEQELADLQNRIQEFQQNGQAKLQEEQTNLTQPIFTKVDKAIKDVGKEGGFIYVFDVAKGQLLYFDDTKSVNILTLVKTKLGVK